MTAINGLVLHVQVGNNSLYGWFNNPSSDASAHFWCAKTGKIEQYVDTDLTAWAQQDGNPYYLSVETEGYPHEPLTAAQLNQVARLLEWSADTYDFPIVGPVPHGAKGFTPHCNPNGTPDPAWGNHPCPESIRLGQMPTIITLAQPAPIPIELQEYDIMDSVTLNDGTVVSHFRTPDDHYIEMTRKPGTAGTAPTGGSVSLIDITASYPGFKAAG
jgi:hypothetical protein